MNTPNLISFFRTALTLLAVLVLCATQAQASLAPANELGQYRYLIEFSEPGLLAAQDRAPGERFDPQAPEVVAHRDLLRSRHDSFVSELTAGLARALEVTHRYLVTHSGMAVWLTPVEAELVHAMPGVVSVERERIERLDTYRGPTFIGADLVWDGTATPDGSGSHGEGTVIAILDTGVDPNHPSFANDPFCGHGEDGAPDKLISLVDCATTDLDGRCNGPAPFDTQSHGSHVAGTAAGNFLDETADPPPEPFAAISGVAPCAHIRSYKVCPDISCPGALIQAGMNTVLLDGDVDVMNFSISGGNDPWNDNDRRKLDLVDAGVVVSASAGNTFPVLTPNPVGEVGHLGPWVMTVAASTHDGGDVAQPLLSVDGPGGEFPFGTQLISMFKAGSLEGDVPDAQPFKFKPIRRPVDDAVPLDGDHGCATVYTPGYFEGAVALMLRGSPGCALWHQYVEAAEAAGADMVIIRNDQPGSFTFSMLTEPSIPVYGISQSAGDALVAWIESVGGPGDADEATVRVELIVDAGEGGDELASFSLRGPTPPPFQNLTKPDITAPGVSIFAAEPGVPPAVPGGYGFKSGTSMSSPHNAGAAALVRALRPDWTPPEVKSAMMMTAFKDGSKENPEVPWDADDVGSGRTDLTRAALAGLVMHETIDNFLAADPDEGGDVRTLNLPSVRDVSCSPSCSWTRTVRNTLDVPTQWTATGVADDINIEVSPSSFSFDGDTSETQQITISASPIGDQTAAIMFGEVVLSEAGGLSPDLHLTAAVRGESTDPEPGKPVADISPESFEFEVAAGDSASDLMFIDNLGDADLHWSIAMAEGADSAGTQDHDPDLDESFELGEFVLTSPFAGGEPTVFTVEGGVESQGQVTGFSFSGTASGITPTLSWASDTCMVIEAPDGARRVVGGLDGTLDGCGQNFWEFQGEQSNFDGEYSSAHHGAFAPGVDDAGQWTVTFINDWNSPLAGPIVWSDVVVTLHKTSASACDNPGDIDWLHVDPDSGTTAPSFTDLVDVHVDSSGLDEGQYEAVLCVETNDPKAGSVPVPVTLNVVAEPPPPIAEEIDDAHPAIEYRRGWHRLDNPDATFGGYHRRMGSAGGSSGDPPTARLVFEGDWITYLFGTSQQGGSADVYINGAFRGTVDFSGMAPGNSPEFGHSVTFEDLGEGSHEIMIVHRGGAVYVDGFIIGSSSGEAAPDESAAGTQTVTTTSIGQLTALGSGLVLHTVEVGADDEWLSVVVETGASVTVSLLDPAGTLIASGDELLPGSGVIGTDMVPLLAGPYTVQVVAEAGSSGQVKVSTSRTITLD